MYRFLLSARWLAFTAVVFVVVGVCIRLGMWQFDRLDERRAANDRIDANLAAAPASLEAVVADGSTDPDDEWRRVELTGHYDADHQLVVTNQSRDVGAGVDVVTPLRLGDGTAVLVDRGWLTISSPSETPTPPAPVSETVSVTGWLRVDSDADDWATTPDDGTVRAVASDRVAPTVPYPLRSGWVALIDQSPVDGSRLAAPEPPDVGQGPHFFYGLQWWFFAALAFVGYGWFAWQEAHPRPSRQRREISPAPRPTEREEAAS